MAGGLYFYNARYYDPALGRFTQADTLIPNPGNPQNLNGSTMFGGGGVTYSGVSDRQTRRRMGPLDQMLDDQAGGFCGRQLRQRQDGLEQLAHVSHGQDRKLVHLHSWTNAASRA
ncbi:hypothetical protein [Candidatus Amarolinea dominans]|uniref:hypothetical protein n=1 Tax=Candidatus Amarolinea dominans TaxID=3140696 RepID=UPI0031CC8C63